MKYLETVRASLAEKIEARNGLVGELEAITEAAATEERSELSDDETVAFDEARATIGELDTEIAALTEREADLAKVSERQTASAAAVRDVNINVAGITADPYDIELRSTPRTAETRGDIVERSHRALDNDRTLDDSLKHGVDALLRSATNGNGDVSRHILATGRHSYRSAFGKLMTQDHALLDADESRALEEVRAINVTTDGSGGYLMPFTLDPTVLDISSGTINPLRALGTVRTTLTDNWQGVNSAGVSAAYGAESAEVADGTPTFTQPTVPIHKAHSFVPVTMEAEEDFAALSTDLAYMFSESKDTLEATAFCTGTGSGQPTGLVTAALAGTTVESATTDTYAIADVYSLQQAVAPRWRANGSWVMNLNIINLTRQFGTAVAHTFLTDLAGGQPPTLLGQSLHELSTMDGVITADAANPVVLYGDISQYRIHDRLGMTLERIPFLFGANYRPTGERGFYAHWRNGANLVAPDAVKVLDVT